ncbi:MAG: histidine phosphatase family protein [Nanoarchaeota archaeon]
MIELYLIRHAESVKNLKPEFIGGRSNYSDLSKKGIEQAKLLGQRFEYEGINFDEVYCSPALRTKRTLEIVLPNYQGDVLIDDRLQELDEGDWTGRLREEVHNQEALGLMDKDSWNFVPPNGESQSMVGARMKSWLKDYILIKTQDAKIALFGHGLAIKCLLKEIMNFDSNLTWRIYLGNTSITRLDYQPDKMRWSLDRVNDMTHLYNLNHVPSNSHIL